MAGMTADGHAIQYGLEGQPQTAGVGANQQLYFGEVALISGSGSVTSGYLKNAATPGSADLVVGMLDEPTGGTYVSTGPGILGGTTDGAVWVDVKQGSFFFQNSVKNPVSASTVFKTVYYEGENATGPIVSSSSVGGTLPTLGVLEPQDPGIAGGFTPGSTYWPVKLTTIGSP